MLLTELSMSAAEFEAATGWAAKPEGMCKGAMCVPAPGAIAPDEVLYVARVAGRVGMALVEDAGRGVWAMGPESGGRALTTAVTPELELPDADGNPFKLSAMHGRKVLLVAWASW